MILRQCKDCIYCKYENGYKTAAMCIKVKPPDIIRTDQKICDSFKQKG